jgi:ankyrin repeat protein
LDVIFQCRTDDAIRQELKFLDQATSVSSVVERLKPLYSRMVAAVLSQQEHDRQLALSALMWLSQYDGSLRTDIILEIISRTCFPPGGSEMLSCPELVDCCRGLVVVVNSHDLRFVHLTLLHYLRDCPILPREQVHILLTKASLAYFAPSELGTFAEAHILCWLKQVGVMSEHLRAVEKATVIEFEQFLSSGTCAPRSLLPDSLNHFYVWVGFGFEPIFSARVSHSKLQLATLLGRRDYVSRKLLQGSRDAVDKGSPTLLALAAAMPRQLEMMRILLDRGASPNAVAWKKSRPLHWAAAAGNYPAAELLLEKGALVDAVGTRKNTALHVATINNNMGLVKLLVAHDADVRAQGKEGRTPLHMACADGYLTLVKFFVTQQARTWVALRDSSGCTPLHTAAIEGRVQVVARLLNMSMGSMKDKTSRTSFLEAKDCQGRTALIAAVDECRRTDVNNLIEVVMALLRHGANLSASDCAALHGLCAFTPHPRIAGTIMLALLECGADASFKNNHSLTPLHLLARRLPPQTHLMTLLLQHNASGGLVSSPDAAGCTPLHNAVMSAECLSLLLVLGASANERDLLGWTALHWIAFSNDTDVDDVESRIDVRTTLKMSAVSQWCPSVRNESCLFLSSDFSTSFSSETYLFRPCFTVVFAVFDDLRLSLSPAGLSLCPAAL